jgi:hypothetical protein
MAARVSGELAEFRPGWSIRIGLPFHAAGGIEARRADGTNSGPADPIGRTTESPINATTGTTMQSVPAYWARRIVAVGEEDARRERREADTEHNVSTLRASREVLSWFVPFRKVLRQEAERELEGA